MQAIITKKNHSLNPGVVKLEMIKLAITLKLEKIKV